MPSPPPAGVYVPVPTFFVSKKAANYNASAAPLDPETQAAHALHLAKSGITGLVVLGSTGEAVHLTNKERFEILSGVRKAFDDAGYKDYPIIAGTAAQNIEEVVDQLKSAKEAGSQWGLCLTPGFFSGASSQDGIIRWFTAVADQSPIPIMIYHYPGVSNNVKVVPSTYAALSRHPNIVGCKLSHGDVSYHAQIGANPKIDNKHFHTFTGLGQQLLPVVVLGCAGTIDGTAGFFPKSVVHLYKLSVKNQPTDAEVAERRLLQYKVSSVEELVVKFGTVGIKEAVSRILGMGDRDGTRLPLAGGISGGDNEWEAWKEVIGDLDAVEKSL
ncbi:dihydrodipicolinate synthetase family protein [Drepanopeziza brunnea f. sp. 'multigermtubi' MB_m1]|uniref:Dihydrodipicolinate synthetase family protein n=1 Tax=Marssonina brunnea f. sp. multigermtubi (strain MB_m1) TaxID=1072389 RepID=K1XW78_MARBU|nr:dihydrodipicolinate synthetase family protein [Drepanopeziza brunnea f. sp. 'multigermtubi' MB_m1]EKD17009.1 dihydrodipicolinate synthetase family protein [Drepanopeziza brunnea f. sp. 'multigermtubi' MB_m1]